MPPLMARQAALEAEEGVAVASCAEREARGVALAALAQPGLLGVLRSRLDIGAQRHDCCKEVTRSRLPRKVWSQKQLETPPGESEGADSIPERKRGELAGEVTSELQVVGKAASIAITDMGAKQRQDQGTGRGTREEYRVDKAPVHGMEGEPR